MGNNLAPRLVLTQGDLKNLKQKTIAIDASPFIYGALYNSYRTGRSVGPLASKEGRLTGHIVRILGLVSRLKQEYGIDTIICIDDKQPLLKEGTTDRRRQNSTATLQKIRDREARGPLTLTEQKTKLLLQTMGNKESRYQLVEDLIKALWLAGVPYARLPGHEAEKIGHNLRRAGLVEHVCSPDRDVCIYGSNVITRIDASRGAYEETLVQQSMLALGLTSLIQLQLAAIASGTDYHPGLRGVGPVSAISQIRREGALAFKERMRVAGIPVDEILAYYDDPSGPQGLVRGVFDPEALRAYLKELDFSERQILKYIVRLGGIDFDRVTFRRE